MANSSGQDIARQTLTDRLLDAVKQCQIRFGGKTELATEKDSRISCLCAQWVTALQFGMKSNKKINPLRHVTGQVLLRNEGQSVFWQFVKEHLSATEIRRFNSLENVNTDTGRDQGIETMQPLRFLCCFIAHAWLRSALNEQSLEKYLHSFLGHKQLLSAYYEQDALLLDEERSSMLPMMAAGLSSILFAIKIDDAEFNISKQASTNGNLNIQLAPVNVVQSSMKKEPSPMYSTYGAPVKEKKKRKKKKPTIAQIENVEFDDEESPDDPKMSETSEEVLTNHEPDIPQVDVSYSNPSLTITNQAGETSRNPVYYEKQSRETNFEDLKVEETRTEKIVKNQKFYFLEGSGLQATANIPVSKPRLSISSDNSVSSQPAEEGPVLDHSRDEPLVDLSSGVALTPVSCPDETTAWALAESKDRESPGNEGLPVVATRLFAGSNHDSPVSSVCTDDDVGDDYTSLAIGATDAVISATQDVHKEIADFTSSSLVRTMGDGRMSPPSEASGTKEMTSGELKQAIVSMMLRKDEVEESNRSLRQLLDKEMQESASLRDQVDDLRRELSSSNETFHATLHTLTSENDLLKHQLKKYVAAVQSLRRNESLDIGNDEEKRDFERKLIQVADMHGELIELNDRLQKMLNIREHQLRRLREELIDLRGPLPEDGNLDDSSSLEGLGPRLVQVNTRPLINIWIPSAFAQGRSSNVHHTYQVYVRIKDDEWNVYRRYSDFYGLHKKISKQYPAVSQFKFPQKKVLGNRDAKFVETRRKNLQRYLRKLINYSLRIVPELSENPCKTTLLNWFPFFGQTANESGVQKSSNPNIPAHYTGI
ncbi:sorting nexin-29-like [Dendronephthya gigantea]|uniref:sorting nexin-29-like n=1 Tax=Dendronephthya gigantea TaxID=151771 RepID=UPI00106C416A|nr:sorting nexin-29-like [Dendronephthya gigantea]